MADRATDGSVFSAASSAQLDIQIAAHALEELGAQIVEGRMDVDSLTVFLRGITATLGDANDSISTALDLVISRRNEGQAA